MTVETVELFPARLEACHGLMEWEEGAGWCVTIRCRFVTPAGHAEWTTERYRRLVHDEAVMVLVEELGAKTA